MFKKEVHDQIRTEIPDYVQILAASKTKSIEDIKSAIEAGINIIGENYVQEAEEKYNLLKEIFKEKNIKFHLIGHLQSNKAKIAAAIFDCIQTIDSEKIAEKINKHSAELNKIMNIFIELNFDEKQKSGISLGNLDELIKKIKYLKNLHLLGFMAIPPLGKEKECFRIVNELREKYNLKELSIGMSKDYKEAIKNNSTLIRLGTILFGER